MKDNETILQRLFIHLFAKIRLFPTRLNNVFATQRAQKNGRFVNVLLNLYRLSISFSIFDSISLKSKKIKMYNMKKFVLSLSLLVVAFVGMNGAIAQTTSEITVSGSEVPKDGPKISVDKEVHNYGTIEQGGNGVCVFTVTNTGNAPLIISLCKGSCGCTVPQCAKEPIAPGATTEISVKYDTKRVGPISKNVKITSNAVNEPVKTIKIAGTVKAKPTGGAPMNSGGPTVN